MSKNSQTAPQKPARSSTDHRHNASYESNGPMPRESNQEMNRPMFVRAIVSGVGVHSGVVKAGR